MKASIDDMSTESGDYQRKVKYIRPIFSFSMYVFKIHQLQQNFLATQAKLRTCQQEVRSSDVFLIAFDALRVASICSRFGVE